MSILTEGEMDKAFDASMAKRAKDASNAETRRLFAIEVESALLEKLAGMELPEPVYRAVQATSDGSFIGGGKPNWDKREFNEPWLAAGRAVVTNLYTADQLHQAYAQGAASVLSAEPVACIVETSDGANMVWPIADLDEARTYCADDDEPVLLHTLKTIK